MFKKLFLFINLFFPTFLSAVAYKIEVFKDENDNYVHLVYDIHADIEDLRETNKQQKELLEIIKKSNNSYLIVEDMQNINYETLFKFKPVKIKSEIFTFMNLCKKGDFIKVDYKFKFNDIKYDSYLDVSIAANLLKKAEKIGIDGHNIEFRHIMYSSMNEKSNILGSLVIKNMDNIVDGLMKEINETENESLITFCNAKKEEYYSDKNLVRLKLIDSELSMHELGMCHDYIVSTDESDSGLCCGILDINMINQIYKNRYKMNVFVCAGGWHLDNISKLLPELGYKLVDKVEVIEGEDEEFVIVNAVNIGKFYTGFNKLVNRPKFKKSKLN